MVSKLDEQTYTSEFESQWVPLSYGLVPHLSKMLSKLQPYKNQILALSIVTIYTLSINKSNYVK